MQSFIDFLKEDLITFNKRAYPKFGNIVILAGGAGSGKGFVKKKLLGIEGFSFDVDEMKKMASAAPRINERVKKELGIDMKKLSSNLKDPANVSKLHEIIGDYLELDERRLKVFYTSIFAAAPDRKPNIIFDVTLSSLTRLEELTRQVNNLGYEKDNVHIVWVVNDIEVAKSQNETRARKVPVEILVNTHRGASQTLADILNMGKTLDNYMNGDIVFAFNKVKVDTEVSFSGKGGMYLKNTNYFYAKKAGKPPLSTKQLSVSIKSKIAEYVPKSVDWSK